MVDEWPLRDQGIALDTPSVGRVTRVSLGALSGSIDMSQEKTTYLGPMLLTLIAGAVLGAAVVALTTPKTGRELRGDLKDFGRRARWKAERIAQGFRGEAAAPELERDLADAVNDLRG
jgi:hypothetical protein